jgi:hypothetical protein
LFFTDSISWKGNEERGKEMRGREMRGEEGK